MQSEARLRDVDMALRDNTLVINSSLKQANASSRLVWSIQSKLNALQSSQIIRIEKEHAPQSFHGNSCTPRTASADCSLR